MLQIKVGNDSYTQKYDWKGRKEVLILDGAVDHQIWDEVVAGTTRDQRQDWIKSVHDPRLRELHLAQRGGGPIDVTAILGQSWKENQALYFLGNPEGNHQRLEFGEMGQSGSNFQLITAARNPEVGSLDHTVSANFSFGEIQTENIAETLKLTE